MKSLQQVYDSFPCSGCLFDGRNHLEPCYGAGGEHLCCSPKMLRLRYGRWMDKWCMSSVLLDAQPVLLVWGEAVCSVQGSKVWHKCLMLC